MAGAADPATRFPPCAGCGCGALSTLWQQARSPRLLAVGVVVALTLTVAALLTGMSPDWVDPGRRQVVGAPGEEITAIGDSLVVAEGFDSLPGP